MTFLLVGDSALHLAVRTNQAESLSSLLTVYEADPNVVNSIGLTPLELAIDKGKLHLNVKINEINQLITIINY